MDSLPVPHSTAEWMEMNMIAFKRLGGQERGVILQHDAKKFAGIFVACYILGINVWY